MPKVFLRPSGQEIEIDDKTNLLEALRAQGIYVKSSCAGVASCGDCVIKILSGEDHLSEATFGELKLLGNVFHITKERLACQTTISGDVTIDLSGHDKNADEMKLRSKTHQRPFKKSTVVRKKDTVEKIREERLKEKEKHEQEKKLGQEDQPWMRHWEKGTKNAKGQGGKQRPKMFRTDHLEEEPISTERSSQNESTDPRPKRAQFSRDKKK